MPKDTATGGAARATKSRIKRATSGGRKKPTPIRRKPATQKIVIRDLTLSCLIGVYDEERARRQRIRLNLEFDVTPNRPVADSIEETVDYSKVIAGVRQACLESGVLLLETLASRIADGSFLDPRVQAARIRIEKLDRYADTGGIGVEMVFRRSGR